jgi:hypothetical protein
MPFVILFGSPFTQAWDDLSELASRHTVPRNVSATTTARKGELVGLGASRTIMRMCGGCQPDGS